MLSGVCAYLHLEPLVAWGMRANGSALIKEGGRPVYAHRELISNQPVTVPDVLGQLTTGFAWAIEVKRPGAWPRLATLEKYACARGALGKPQARTLAQWEFLKAVYEAGGAAGVAEAPSDAIEIIQRRAPLGLYTDHPRGKQR